MDALAYVRWSTEEQSKGSSEKRQTDLASMMCIQRGWTLRETIIESGKSAYHGLNRAAGGKLAAIEKRAADGKLAGMVLIVENLDRLSRQEPLESLTLLQSLTNAGLTIAESSSGQTYTAQAIKENWQNLLVAFIRAGLAYDESAKKAKRIKAAWEASRQRGTTKDGKADARYCPGWIRVENGQYVVIKDRSQIISRIFELSASGVGINRIARILNGEPNTRWTRGPWSSSNLSELLRSRQPLGEYLPHEKLPDGTRRPVGDWTKQYPPIITEELWHRVQQGLELRKVAGGPSTGFRNALQGLVRCSVCQSPMHMVSGWNSQDRSQKGLICSSYHRGQGCKSKRRLHYNPLIEGVLDNLLKFAVPSPETNLAIESVAIAEAELAAALKRLDNLTDGYAETGSEAMKRGIQRVEADIAAQKDDLNRLRRAVEAEDSRRGVDVIAVEVERLRAKMRECADTRRTVNSMLREVIDGMWFYPEQSETHVLVAGVHAFKFNAKGVLIQEAVATSALLDGAHNDNPLALGRYKQRKS